MNVWTLSTATPLFICSVFALAIILERTVFYVRIHKMPLGARSNFKDALKADKPLLALDTLRLTKVFYSDALHSLNHHYKMDKALRDEAVEIEMRPIVAGLRKNFAGILTIAALAPMAGLLGTVVGLMRSFRDIGLTKGPVDPSVIADGLWQALATTAAGLVIAGVCIFAHAVLSSKSRRLLREADQVLNQISLSIASQTLSEASRD